MQTNHYMLAALLGVAGFAASPAAAQDKKESAPKIDSTSPGGVSYATGGYSYEVPALSIGAGGFPQGLQLTYQYRSDGARTPSTPWTTNLDVRTSLTKTNTQMESICPPYCNPGDFTWSRNIVVGHRSASFYKTGPGAGPATYTSTQLDGAKLEWTPTGTYTGKYVYTSSDGAEIVFDVMPLAGTSNSPPASWTEPDGTVITYGASSISTNRGVALYYESGSGKVCAINLTEYYLPALSACPSTVPTVTVARSGARITSITNPAGGVTSFTYGSGGRGDDGHLTCVTEPGQSSCTVTNTYDTCDGYGTDAYYDDQWNGSRDRVTAQSFATGESIAYSYTNMQIPSGTTMIACRGNSQAVMTRDSQSVTIGTSPSSAPDSIQNELGKTTTISYTGPDIDYPDLTRPSVYTLPEGNSVELTYDDRGNVTETRRKAKPGSGLADIVSSATYPASCSASGITAKTCNKPITVTDARGNTTSYTYDGQHGGVLTETAPAVQVDGAGSAIAPIKRYAYVQRYAWLKNSGGTFSQAATPVWVLDQERTCRTTTTTTSSATTTGCSGGSNDEIVTAYDYGPDTGLVGNNLWLRGKTVTAYDFVTGGPITLRTCYGYDSQGNKIWETTPRAGLTACN
ncbi:hypothetical protein [Sphingomonas soli]|uniref:hypothetical protein n=1 Tax=Sphingomonas soli TaxID=266127 RepID=UPI0008362529|nr:hypothetical protein [Sphingomonas soli]